MCFWALLVTDLLEIPDGCLAAGGQSQPSSLCRCRLRHVIVHLLLGTDLLALALDLPDTQQHQPGNEGCLKWLNGVDDLFVKRTSQRPVKSFPRIIRTV